MNEETAKLIKLISENKTLNEISNMMNLSKKQLFTRMFMLRNYGYLIDKKYYYNGDISYYLTNPFTNEKPLTIHTPSDMKNIRMILTSDSHFGNVKEDLECTDKIFDYCTKENISLIFHLGDFFEGVTRDSIKKQKYNSVQEQIKATLNNYPFSDNILTITLLGNHDASFWLDAGMDIKTILENKRHDIIPIGYGQEIVNLSGCRFVLKHPIERCKVNSKNYNPNMEKIIFHGHSHRFKLISEKDKLNIFVPSSSSISIQENPNFLGTGIPSIIDAEFIIESNKITSGIFKHYILLNNQLIKVGEHVTVNNIQLNPNLGETKKEIKPNFLTCFDFDDKEKNITSQVKEIPKVRTKTIDK